MKITVLRSSDQTRISSMFMDSRVIASSAPNGSSISRTLGSRIKARQIDTRCCIPPDSSNGYFRAKSFSPMKSSRRSARARVAADASPFNCAGSMTLLRTVFHGSSTACWNTTPASGRGLVTISPPQRTVPEDALSRPARMRSSVVLPQPLGPTTEMNSLSPMSTLTSDSATTISPDRDENRFPKPAIRISAADGRSDTGWRPPSPLSSDRTSNCVMIPIFYRRNGALIQIKYSTVDRLVN